jgi:thioredoxin reductase
MSTDRTFIIVGAGPAGAEAAKTQADREKVHIEGRLA